VLVCSSSSGSFGKLGSLSSFDSTFNSIIGWGVSGVGSSFGSSLKSILFGPNSLNLSPSSSCKSNVGSSSVGGSSVGISTSSFGSSSFGSIELV
jgi:hypothetical protein